MKYWLMKTEPSTFSWDDLMNAENQTSCWEGVRNYQARNFMRDDMKIGDGVLFYHSVAKPMAIMGTARVTKESYPDHFSWDKKSPYYDPKSSKENPRWFMVDVTFDRSFDPPLTMDEIKTVPELQDMMLLRKGSRLSIQPVTEKEWKKINQLRPINKIRKKQ